MKKYKDVEIRCFKDSRYCHYAESYRNLHDVDIEQKLEQLRQAGWLKFVVIINGDERQKIKIDYQTKINANKKSPGKSTRSNEENPSNRVKSRKNRV